MLHLAASRVTGEDHPDHRTTWRRTGGSTSRHHTSLSPVTSRDSHAEIRDNTAKELTPSQLAEAQRRAAEWQTAFEQRQDERLLGSTLGSQQR